MTKSRIFLAITIAFFYSRFFAQTNFDFIKLIKSADSLIVATNNRENSIILITPSGARTIASTPGSGRYAEYDALGKGIFYKHINSESGMQKPAFYDLRQNKIVFLEEDAKRAGQPSCSKNGYIAYFVENELIVRNFDKGFYKKFKFDFFSNRSPISPDGNFVVVKNENDELFLFNISEEKLKKISPDNISCYNALWSADGKYISFVSTKMEIFIYDLANEKAKFIDLGETLDWSEKGNLLLYESKKFDESNLRFVDRKLSLYNSLEEKIISIKNIGDEEFVSATFNEDSKAVILFNSSFPDRLKKLDFESGKEKDKFLLKGLKTNFDSSNQNNNKVDNVQNEIVIAKNIDWIHIHQVYHTRQDWNQGRSCCGAATAAQILATYGVYTPKPIYTYTYWSNYGYYISDKYTYNNITYDNFTGVWPSGGHGYMWRSGYSPYSSFVSFLTNHKIDYAYRLDYPSFADVKNELQNGHSYVICSAGLTSGHIVLAVGYYGNYQTLVCNDPYGDKNAGSYGYVVNGKYAIYDWGDENTGRQKITPAVWGIRVRHQPKEPAQVWRTYPSNSGDTVYNIESISFEFTRQLDTNSIKSAFRIAPNANYKLIFQDFGRKIVVKPVEKFSANENYQITIDTSARDVFGVKLNENFVFDFKTHSRNKLSLAKNYPFMNSTQVPIRNQFILQFDGKMTAGALTGKISLYDRNGSKVTLANLKHEVNEVGSKFSFEPKNPLNYNDSYRLTLAANVSDLIGYTLEEEMNIIFTTEDKRYENGISICDFENLNGWIISEDSSLTKNANMAKTALELSSTRKLYGNYSVSLKYSFVKDSLDAKVCIDNLDGFNIGLPNRLFGVWIFGDYSGNRIKFLFKENESGEKISLSASDINWAGWKFVFVDLSQLNSIENISYIGAIVERTENSDSEGQIFFDNALADFMVGLDQLDANSVKVDNFIVEQNYPNPFNSSTTLNFFMPNESGVEILMYNSLGLFIKEVYKGKASKGSNYVAISGEELASGIYFVVVRTIFGQKSVKMILLK